MAPTTTLAHRKKHKQRRNSKIWERCGGGALVRQRGGCLVGIMCWSGSLLFLSYYLYNMWVLHQNAGRMAEEDRGAPGIPRRSNTALVEVGQKKKKNVAPPRPNAYQDHSQEHQKEKGNDAPTVVISLATLNTIPLQWRKDGPPPVAQVHCLGLQDRIDNNNNNESSSLLSWMFRSCEYRNLCIDLQTHEYVLFVHDDNDDDTVPDLALGPINPRWNMGHGLDRGWDKVRWKPSVVVQRRRSVTTTTASNNTTLSYSYYQLPATITLLPFHSMAGHNIGHLAWDDLWAVYKLGRQFSTPSPPHNDPRLLLLRHQINETLYANCDIRRNKRIQCRANLERFVPLLGIDPHTFSTTKQLQLLQTNDDNTHLVCARRGLAGLGLLQDHGFRDHGWDDTTTTTTLVGGATSAVLTVPHNLGAGRTFYDYAQLLRHHALENLTDDTATTIAETTTKTRRMGGVQPAHVPVITFSLRSSQDWMRRQNFTAQIEALQSLSSSSAAAQPNWQIQALDLRELTLPEQVRLASTTNIFVTTCGGGAVTATFLPRGATLVVFYDAQGGLDFDTLSSNHQPARLDWDLLNYAAGAHLRVHWLPVNTMHEPDDLQLFVLLVQHEIAIMRQIEKDND